MKTNIILVGIALNLILLILPASASDYTLGIFGNANGDDNINMQDVTYTELIILEYKDQTQLADAKYDGEVDILDVTQIELIILGKEKELTFLDLFGEAETVNKPIQRLANLGTFGIEITRIIDAKDILLPIVGWDRSNYYPTFFPEFANWQSVGYNSQNCDFEKILSLKPDVVQTNLEAAFSLVGGLEQKRVFEEKLPGIPIICLNMREPHTLPENVRKYGYILDREDEAEEFIDWFEGHLNILKTRTEGLSEDEKPRGCIGFRIYEFKASGDRLAQTFLLAGGKNIIDEIVDPDSPEYGSVINVDPEWLIEQNPEYIFIGDYSRTLNGYETDDQTEVAALRQEIMDRPELANVDAVKNGHIYIVSDCILSGAGNNVIGGLYMAKLLQPDLFEDVDPQAIHQEYVDEFCHIDFDVSEHGVFIYPPLEES